MTYMSEQQYVKQQYVKQGPGLCPYCGSEDHDESNLEQTNDNTAFKDRRCRKCNAEWTETWQVTDVDADFL